ncbi:hypothetical protein EniLVp02_0234 [Vibrio phage EniLVp02]
MKFHWRQTSGRCRCRLCDWTIDPADQVVYIETRAGGKRVEVFICNDCLAELPEALKGLDKTLKRSVGGKLREYRHEYLPEPEPFEQE